MWQRIITAEGEMLSTQVLERLRQERIHVAPRALELSPPAVQQRFATIWAPLAAMLASLTWLPPGLLLFWLDLANGHVVITHLASRYEPGEQQLKTQTLHGVAFVSAADLAADSVEALVPVGHLLDHLLGSGGEDGGQRLSDGSGVRPELLAVGERLAKLFSLGHGFDAGARHDPGSYFARSFALYLHDRQALNVADPLMERLLRTSLLSARFWQSLRAPRPL